MKKIKNPFLKLDDYNCFGCCPNNPIGLKLNFILEEDNTVSTKWKPTKLYEGWQNILHGGIQATLMDEIASWVVFSVLKTAGYTIKMNISLKKAVKISEGEITLKARFVNQNHNLAYIDVKLYNSKNELCSEGEFVYLIYEKSIAVKRFYMPENDNELFEES